MRAVRTTLASDVETSRERPELPKAARTVRVGLLGLGTVGNGVVEILERHRELIASRTGVEIEVVRALVRNSRRKRPGVARVVPLTTRVDDIIGSPDVDVVVELMGGHEPALSCVLNALAAGQPVVTANKAILATHRKEIFAAAAKSKRDVYFEAAVAGGIPIIRTLREGLASDRITRLVGILNGTTNYILGKMALGATYAHALAEAQALGYAEADPSRDVGGNDAGDKLAILAHLAFGVHVQPGNIPTEGITGLTPQVLADADRLGYAVKLLGFARREGAALDLRVHPAMVPKAHPLAAVPAAQNAISVQSDALGSTLYQGPGAGGLPTGSAVVSDLIEVARNVRAGIAGRVVEGKGAGAPRLLRPRDSSSAYYIRLEVKEQPGVLAAVTRILAREKISLSTVLQEEHRGGQPVPVVLTTHTTSAGAMQKALTKIAGLPSLGEPPKVVRIEHLTPSEHERGD